MESQVRIVVEGRVQGVGFRDWTRRQAQARGLSGYVRNRADGTVEAMFCGAESAVNEMVELCREGPRLAAVTRLETYPPATGTWTDFTILPAE